MGTFISDHFRKKSSRKGVAKCTYKATKIRLGEV